MSSPVHHAKDLDAALMYAPPWVRDQTGARDQTRPISAEHGVAAAESPLRSRRLGGAGRAFSGDLAMQQLQRQLTLDPDSVPEPPWMTGHDQTVWPAVLRGCAVAGVAAIVAWGVVLLPGARKSGNEAV